MTKRKKGLQWLARVQANSFQFTVGNFDEEIDAAYAYDAGAYALHGRSVLPTFAQATLFLDSLTSWPSTYSECMSHCAVLGHWCKKQTEAVLL